MKSTEPKTHVVVRTEKYNTYYAITHTQSARSGRLSPRQAAMGASGGGGGGQCQRNRALLACMAVGGGLDGQVIINGATRIDIHWSTIVVGSGVPG